MLSPDSRTALAELEPVSDLRDENDNLLGLELLPADVLLRYSLG